MQLQRGHIDHATRPNVILICVDQWRRDCLSGSGHPVVETPFLDQLALRGVRFDRAYAATPTCIPARATLMTGLNQQHTGRIGYLDGVQWDYPVTMAGEFSRQGYQSEAIGKLHAYPQRSQLGFQHVQLHDGFLHYSRSRNSALSMNDDYVDWLQREAHYGADYFDHGLNCNGVTTRPWDKPEYQHPSTWVASRAVDFIPRRDPRKPFFLYLGFHRPHPPYDPPQWAFDQYVRQEMPEPVIGDWSPRLDPFAIDTQHDAHVARYPRKILDRAKAGYYGHMSHIDHLINRLVEALHGADLLDTTYICFTSDHGEMMGDHNMFRKGYPYEGSAGVPFILSGPGLPRGTTSDALIELRDVMPTLLDCAGLDVPDGLDGRSVVPLARAEADSIRPWIHGEHTVFGQSVQWVTDGFEKYIWWSELGEEQFFDLVRDPEERTDLGTDPGSADRLARWRSILVEQLAGREDGLSDGTRLVAGQAVSPVLPTVIDRFHSEAVAVGSQS